MTHRVTAALAISTLALLMACEQKPSTNPPHADALTPRSPADAVSTGQEHLILRDDELGELRQAGLDGNAAAAARVASHYAELSIEDRRHMQDASMWISIAAENGNLACMVLKAKELYEVGGQDNCQRAMFWLRRADSLATNQEEKDHVQSWMKQVSSDSSACTRPAKTALQTPAQ
jgi:hypothetical protein